MILAGSEAPNERALEALQVGDRCTTCANEIIRRDRKHVVPRPSRRPHLVVLQQIRVDEHAQTGLVTEGGHATSGFGNLLTQTEPGLASQVGFDEGPVLGISDRDITRNRQVVSGLFRISQGGE